MKVTLAKIKSLSGKYQPLAAMNAKYLWLSTPYSSYRMEKDSISADLQTAGFRLTYSGYPYKLWDEFSPEQKELYKKPLQLIYSDTTLFYVYKIGKFYVKINMQFVPDDTAYMKAKKGAPHKSPIFCFNSENELIAVVMPIQLPQDAAREKYAPHK